MPENIPRILEDDEFRSGCRNHPVRKLSVAYVVHDFSEQSFNGVIIDHRRSHQMYLFQPTKLLSMRTVGEYALHVAKDSPINHLMCSIQQRVRAFELAACFDIGINHLTFDA